MSAKQNVNTEMSYGKNKEHFCQCSI